jgi:hypothetical protein
MDWESRVEAALDDMQARNETLQSQLGALQAALMRARMAPRLQPAPARAACVPAAAPAPPVAQPPAAPEGSAESGEPSSSTQSRGPALPAAPLSGAPRAPGAAPPRAAQLAALKRFAAEHRLELYTTGVGTGSDPRRPISARQRRRQPRRRRAPTAHQRPHAQPLTALECCARARALHPTPGPLTIRPFAGARCRRRAP